MATAIGNAAGRAEVARLAAEQAALRRVATLVAQGAGPGAVFAAVTQEVVALVDASAVTLARYDDEMLTVLATRGRAAFMGVGERIPLGGANITSIVLRTGEIARLDDYGLATGSIGTYARQVGVQSSPRRSATPNVR